MKTHEPIPKDYAVQPLKRGQNPKGKATCGHCGLSWDDDKVTSMTPAPSARCPFEPFHVYPEEARAEKSLKLTDPEMVVLTQCIALMQDAVANGSDPWGAYEEDEPLSSRKAFLAAIKSAKAHCAHCPKCGANWLTVFETCRSCGAQLTFVETPIEQQGANGMICMTPAESDPATDFAATLGGIEVCAETCDGEEYRGTIEF